MQTIEITTTQNVVIQVRLATLTDRIVGFIIDLISMGLLYLLLVFLITRITYEDWPFYVAIIALWFYSLIFEVIFRGRSIGKYVMGIRVTKVDGSQPDFIDYFRRWAVRWIDIYMSFGGVALVSVSTSDKGQRLGDKLADTIVVKKRQFSNYGLRDIITISDQTTYKPVYNEVVQIPESSMLTIKRLLNRSIEYPNVSTYDELIETTAERIQTELNIEAGKRTPTDFLKTVLKDYVVLTR